MVNGRPNLLESELIGVVFHPTLAVSEAVNRIERWTQDHRTVAPLVAAAR